MKWIRTATAVGLMLFTSAIAAQDLTNPGWSSLGPSQTQMTPVEQPEEKLVWEVNANVANLAANVPRVRVPVGRGSSVGTGTYLGDKLILSCAHVFEDYQRIGERCWIEFPHGERIPGTMRAIDRNWDQSVIEMDYDPKEAFLTGVELAANEVYFGDDVRFFGYENGTKLYTTYGRVEAFRSYASQQRVDSTDWFEVDTGVVSGWSGGPAFNERNLLIGNLWGSTGNQTVAVVLGRTRRFLFPWNARLAAWRLQVAGALAQAQVGQSGQCWGTPQTGGRPVVGGGYRPTPIDPKPPVDGADEGRVPNYRGEKGEKGDPGDRGPEGPPGLPADPAILEELRQKIAQLEQRLESLESEAGTPFTVEVLDSQGNVLQSAEVTPHGGYLGINLIPVN